MPMWKGTIVLFYIDFICNFYYFLFGFLLTVHLWIVLA